MRNLLMTALMLMVVVLMFIQVVSGSGGLRDQIEAKGSDAIAQISNVTP
ncbi:hypothetical protein [Xylanibacillus composti]|uniref:Uncharacterized protein n=1 Tax=Xylanibacillus composti TaxID=1572762 RepID=A0A8J4M4B7_9BACL|nr:hypothetical protein [Xylanibacillus composti]GIQ71017.1 hypothetical protein XYCOK13_38410 [Xylanibacillus composti]